MTVTVKQPTMLFAPARPHPNDVDRKRIERALEQRKRYRYVEPGVRAASDGYRITSPCCSRNVDPDGGVIDIALMQYVPEHDGWRLYRMDHRERQWRLHGEAPRLHALLQQVNEDPQRIFWP